MLASCFSKSMLLGFLFASAHAAPIKQSSATVTKRQSQLTFTLLDYPDFQISGGVAGNAEEEAAAVFVTPFEGVDLTTVSADTLTALKTMRELAEDAEVELFNPQIEAASGAEAEALQIGKIKNKVLKLTGIVQVTRIEIAQLEAEGQDSSERQAKLDEELTKLNNNIASDTENAGAPSQAASGSVSVRAGRPQPGGSSSVGDAAEVVDEAPAPDVAETPEVADEEKAPEVVEEAPEAEPLTEEPATPASTSFTFQDYSAFQISDGVAGDAEAEAAAIFITPFEGVDLATVSDEDLESMSIMRELAEDAETELFNAQIDAATGAEAEALEVGKIKNKVLKLTAFSQVLEIKIAKAQAAGEDSSADEEKLVEEQGKLAKNIATDVANAGAASQAATGEPTPRKLKARGFSATVRLGRWH